MRRKPCERKLIEFGLFELHSKMFFAQNTEEEESRPAGNNPPGAHEQAVRVTADEAGGEFRGIFPPRTRECKPSGFQIFIFIETVKSLH